MYILFASDEPQPSFMPSPQQCSPTFVDFLQSHRYFWRPCLIIGMRVAPVIAMYYLMRREAYAVHQMLQEEKQEFHQLIRDEKAAFYARVDQFEASLIPNCSWIKDFMSSIAKRFERNNILQWL